MKLSIKQGATSVSVNIFIADSSSTTGAGLTGLVFNSSGLVAYYMRPRVAATAITLATLAAVTSAYSSGGFKEIDATNAPGWYRFDIPDAVIANAERFVSIHFKGATNMAPLPLEIALESWDNQTAISPTGDTFTRLGAPAGASTAADIASVKTDTGTTIPGRLPAALAADGSIKASIQSFLGTAFTEGAAGRIAAAFKQFFNIASPAATMDHGILVDTATTLTNAPPDSAGVTTLLTKFGGITLLKHWLGMLAGKQAADATALTEIRAAGAGSGTFDPTTDSEEALRDRGDAAWITATGFSTLDAAGIRTAIGLATASLDTQLAALQAQIPADLGTAYANLSNVQATKVLLAVLAGQTSGLAGATAHMKKLDGSADVVVASIDADGNRGVPTLTP